MRTTVLLLLATLLPAATLTAQSFKEQLQKALYAEEVSNDLDAAIGAYRDVIERYDADRKIAATALFRLAECLRKKGDEESANALYQRLLRDFSDQTRLTAPALAQLGIDPEADPAAGTAALDFESREIDNLRAAFADAPDLINAKDDEGIFPLEKYAASGQAKVVAYLIEAGASPDRTNALNRAVLAGHKDIVTILLDAGAAPDRAANISPGKGIANSRLTPLHVAATTGNVAITKLLIDRGADVDSLAYAPLSTGTARNAGRPVQVRGASHSGPLGGERQSDSTPLHIAIANRFPSLAEFLLSNGADPARANAAGQCSTHLAVRAREPGLLKMLLDSGAPADDADSEGYTPLHLAAFGNQADIAAVLLEAGADPHKTTDTGTSAAYFAVDNNNLPLLELLIAKDVRLDNTPEGGVPLIHVAIGTHRDQAILKALLDAGADPSLADEGGRYPIHVAATGDDVAAIKLLLAAGADLESRWGPDTTLALAAKRPLRDACIALIELGADVGARNSRGLTPLHQVASSDDKAVSRTVAKALVSAGALLDATDSNGYTPLHHAAANGNLDLVKYFLSIGADPVRRSNNNRWPLEEAKDSLIKSALAIPTRNAAIKPDQIFAYVPGDHSWRIPQTRAQDGFTPYTLFELLFAVQDAAFTTAKIVRVNHETREVISERTIDITAALEKNDASADLPLRWGDIVEYERRNLFDPGLVPRHTKFLDAHMTRKIQLTINYDPEADDPFASKPFEATIVPVRWADSQDGKTKIPDSSRHFDRSKRLFVGIVSLSDLITTMSGHYNRNITTPLKLTRPLPGPDGKVAPRLLGEGGGDTPLSGFHTLTPLRTGDTVEISIGPDAPARPRVNPNTRSRRVVLPPTPGR